MQPQKGKGIDVRLIAAILVLLCAVLAYVVYSMRGGGEEINRAATTDSTSTSVQISGAAQTPADKLPETNPFKKETNPFKQYSNPFE